MIGSNPIDLGSNPSVPTYFFFEKFVPVPRLFKRQNILPCRIVLLFLVDALRNYCALRELPFCQINNLSSCGLVEVMRTLTSVWQARARPNKSSAQIIVHHQGRYRALAPRGIDRRPIV